jgi:hypothetical protein
MVQSGGKRSRQQANASLFGAAERPGVGWHHLSTMKHCPNLDCTNAVLHGTIGEFFDVADVCPDCGTALAPGEAPRPEPPVFRELETIYEAADGTQAHMIRVALEAEDIPVHIAGEALMGAVGELPATMLQVEVQVPPEFVERARKIALQCEKGSASEEPGL